MNIRSILVPVGALALMALAYRQYGGMGVAAVGGGLLMWLLLHYTRMVNVMAKAANRPIGYVPSAVMLNAKLKTGVNLMHVVAMTQALGEQLSPEGAQPEQFRWTDNTQSSVTCEFANGRLVRWSLQRPVSPADDAVAPESAAQP
jgi:hypothetical protein